MATTPTSGPVPDARATRRTLTKIMARLAADVGGATLERGRDAPGDAPRASDAAERLAAALPRVSPALLAWHVPRKSTGAPDYSAALALVQLGDPGRRPGLHEPWLVARARDESGSIVFGLAVEEPISENESHRWDEYPWRWDRDDRSTLRERWGADLDEIRPTLEALDAGRWADALAPWNVRADEPLTRLLAGDHADRDSRDLTAVWAPRLAAHMARLAPWRLSAATSHLRRGRPMRLFSLGGVNQVRKPGIFLSGDGSRPLLTLEWSGSNERVTEAAWTRPVDLDLVHAGLIAASDIPRAEEG